MSSSPHDHDHDGAEPITDDFHHNSWSANLEHPEHAESRELIFEHAEEAIRNTAGGYHVNLVTHGDQGHPEEYLYPRLQELGSDLDIEWEYIEQCGCGGHVTRVHVS